MVYYLFNYTGTPQSKLLRKGCYHIIAAGAAGRGSKATKADAYHLYHMGLGGTGGITSAAFCIDRSTLINAFVGGMSNFTDDEHALKAGKW